MSALQDLIPTRERMVQQWCVLNAMHRPADMPHGITENDLFEELTARLTRQERLAFWNSKEFSHGTNVANFIKP